MDSLSSLQYSRTIEKEMRIQMKWMEGIDLSDASLLSSDRMYRSVSLTQQPLDLSKFERSKNFKPHATPENITRFKASMGFVYPSYAETQAPLDSRKPVSSYDQLPEAFRSTERYPNGHKLQQETHRRCGAFGAVIEK